MECNRQQGMNVQIKNIISIILIMTGLATAQVRVAVGNFENVSDVIFLDGWSRSVPRMLQSELSQYQGMTLLERQKMDDIFKEHELALSGLVEDSSLADKLGKLAGADILISGSINKVGSHYQIDADIIRVSTTTVRVEIAEATDKDHLKEMIGLLANNIAFQITGNRQYKSKIKIKKYPTPWFLVSGAVFGGLAVLANKSYQTNLDKYKQTTALDKYDTYYDRANSAYKLQGLMMSLTGAAITGALVCWIRNLNGPEIRAGSQNESDIKTGLLFLPGRRTSFSVQIHF